jgi:hypothetical protein
MSAAGFAEEREHLLAAQPKAAEHEVHVLNLNTLTVHTL